MTNEGAVAAVSAFKKIDSDAARCGVKRVNPK